MGLGDTHRIPRRQPCLRPSCRPRLNLVAPCSRRLCCECAVRVVCVLCFATPSPREEEEEEEEEEKMRVLFSRQRGEAEGKEKIKNKHSLFSCPPLFARDRLWVHPRPPFCSWEKKTSQKNKLFALRARELHSESAASRQRADRRQQSQSRYETMAFATSSFAAAQVRDSNRGLIVIALYLWRAGLDFCLTKNTVTGFYFSSLLCSLSRRRKSGEGCGEKALFAISVGGGCIES